MKYNDKACINLKNSKQCKKLILDKTKNKNKSNGHNNVFQFYMALLIFLFPYLIVKVTSVKFPEHFDLRLKYSQCKSLFFVRNQEKCGGCWAFATAEAISDLICINTEGEKQPFISETELITCCEQCFNKANKIRGCSGGYVGQAFKYWVNNGLPSGGLYGDENACKPFPFKEKEEIDGGKLKCVENCQDGSKPVLIKGSDYRFLPKRNEIEMMREIYYNGPVVASLDIYDDFNDYWENNCRGIYQYNSYAPKNGSHSVKIIGWGSEIIDRKTVKYWICVNSWGVNKCDGIFKIRKGVNECQIESWVKAGYIDSETLITTDESIVVLENQFFSFKNLNKDYR